MTNSSITLLPRDTLRISGADSRTFLQGLISNDVSLCQPGSPIYAALLTPQGKFLYDLFVIADGDDLLIDCAAGQGDDLLQKLKAHKLRAKVSVEDVSSEYALFASWGASPVTDGAWTQDPRTSALGTCLLTTKNNAPTTNATPDDYDRHRLSLGVTDGTKDMLSGKSTLQEGNIDLLNGINWSKGCYMGQELTARIHYRGLVKKRLYPVRLEGGFVASGEVITNGGKDCGDMRSSNGSIGLALLDIETAKQAKETSTPLMSGETRLFVLDSSLQAA